MCGRTKLESGSDGLQMVDRGLVFLCALLRRIGEAESHEQELGNAAERIIHCGDAATSPEDKVLGEQVAQPDLRHPTLAMPFGVSPIHFYIGHTNLPKAIVPPRVDYKPVRQTDEEI
jgi:hypothetical protein